MRLCYVVQRYGSMIHGGAETYCRAFAERLVAAGHEVEAYTTCATDYSTWANDLPEGESTEAGVTVRRFPVVRERGPAFDELSHRVLPDPTRPSKADQEEWMRLQGPESPKLIEAIGEVSDRFDLVIFVTYLYYSTYFGLRQAAGNGVLHPMAHDEPPFYLPIFDDMVRLPRALLFLTEEERELVFRRFRLLSVPDEVVGFGVDAPPLDGTVDPVEVQEPYLLYLGRLDESKGCRFLCEWFAAYKSRRPGPWKLVLAGEKIYEPPHHPDITYMGRVTEQQKWRLLAEADFVVQPSFFESLGIVLLEAWSAGTPVLVNGFAEVSVGHCRRSGGGVWFRSYGEFEAACDCLRSDAERRAHMGERGRRYVEERYRWGTVLDRYTSFLAALAEDQER